jgi:hypothetical protein
MRQDEKNKNTLAQIVYPSDQSVLISGDVEHRSSAN